MFFRRIILLLTITTFSFAQYEYSLEDINSTSDTYGINITPSSYIGQVTLHYFGHQNWTTCSARVGNLDDLFQDLLDEGIDNVKIFAIGKSQYNNSNSNWTNGNSIPVMVDPSPYTSWSNWGAGQRDLFFLDADGNYHTDFNITTWNDDQIYATIMELLPEDTLAGDTNGDGILNVLDVVAMVNLVLSGGYDEVADMNSDGALNVLDVVLLVGIILG